MSSDKIERRKLRVFKYVYDGKTYYTQGLYDTEPIIRLCLETKLGLEPGTLNPGIDNIKRPIKDIIKSGDIYIKTHKFIKHRTLIEIRYKYTHEGKVYTAAQGVEGTEPIIRRNLENKLGIPNGTLKPGLEKRIYKNKLHKIINRYDEIREWIKRLLAEDYSLILEFNKKQVSNQMYHSTGYYVVPKDQWDYDTYDKMLEQFDKIAENIKGKIESYGFQNIPYDDKITLSEALELRKTIIKNKNKIYEQSELDRIKKAND